MPDERTLCAKCGGNGTVKIPGGISVCDRCQGDSWEPGSELSALRAEVERLKAALKEIAEFRLKNLVATCPDPDCESPPACDDCTRHDTILRIIRSQAPHQEGTP